MDSYGLDSAIDNLNQRGQYVREQNAIIDEGNATKQTEADKKKSEDSILDDFNYGKDAVQAITSYSGRVKKEALATAQADAQAKATATAKAIADAPEGTTAKPTRILSARERLLQGSSAPDGVYASPPVLNDPASTQPVSAEATATAKRTARQNLISGSSGDAPVLSSSAPTTEPEPSPIGSPPEGSVPTGEKPSLLTRAIKSGTGFSDETAEMAGRVGGAVAGASMGAMSLYDDLDSLDKTGKFFQKGASATDDVSNVTNMIAGASDVVGLVPGLEWVAGLGNAVGGIGGVVKMFGDHAKNVKQQTTDSNVPLTAKLVAPSSSGQLDETAQSNIRQQNVSSSGY